MEQTSDECKVDEMTSAGQSFSEEGGETEARAT